ncbi:class I SAM-dependent methyltransferase [Micromonospora sp. WMMD714]|uniref:class I SAM-dependent methyltransferase n=1 Tax=Micromonospora sp. WMMD714 TaxID=3016097 RepID=UPI00249C7623|nr:class I SAM-dependent methyltransferase [Micromonospora sp. WMMD714]WFE62999.1 class I SAM-dependent methyltransferase [Micromonospora sp. WMMD714]
MTVDRALVGLLAARGAGSDPEIATVVKEAGLTAVVDALVDEILFRCDAPVNPVPVHLAMTVTHGGERRRVVFRIVRDEPIVVLDGDVPSVQREVGFHAVDLVRRLYGRAGQRRLGDFTDAFLPERPADLAQLPAILTSTNQASGTLFSGCTVPRDDLGKLSVAYGSDKWASFHWYTGHYEEEFARYRDRPVRLLEIGIGGFDGELGGASLKMWKKYFHRGLIHGLDLFDKSSLDQGRLTALTADQSDPAALVALAEEHGPFDIVIDDGSHENEHVRISFDALFPYVRPGGLYVIEDMQTSYLPRCGGTAGPVAGPRTTVGLLKRLLDDIHHHEQQPPAGEPPTITQSQVVGVRVYRNIAFVEKGVNGENGIPGWMDDEAWIALGAIPPTDN